MWSEPILSSGGLLRSDWLPPNRVIAHYHKVDLISTLLDALIVPKRALIENEWLPATLTLSPRPVWTHSYCSTGDTFTFGWTIPLTQTQLTSQSSRTTCGLRGESSSNTWPFQPRKRRVRGVFLATVAGSLQQWRETVWVAVMLSKCKNFIWTFPTSNAVCGVKHPAS